MINRLRRLAPEYGLLLLVLFAFLLGGGSRADITSIVLLRPLGVLFLILTVLWFPRDQWRSNRPLLACAFGWLGLTALQLIPLPPGLWEALPGREIIVRIDEAAGLGSVWRPFTMVPWRTMNALLALALPLAGLLLALALRRDVASRLVYLLTLLVFASAALGLLQVIGGEGNAFYFYSITNDGSAVGLFANRNHNAILLCLGFPLIAAAISLLPAAAEQVRLREAAGAGAALLLIPFLLTTQSRAGIVLGMVGIALALWVYRSPEADAQKRRLRRQLDPRLLFGGLAVAALTVLTMALTATNAVERLSRFGQQDDELRLQVWPVILKMIRTYFPWGSGIGTFEDVYRIAEPVRLLKPSYLNHAHNDWLQILVTGGLPFALLLAASAIITMRRGIVGLRRAGGAREGVLRRLGAAIIVILALGSVYDYPLRTPSLALVFAIAVAFWAGAGRAPEAPQRPVAR